MKEEVVILPNKNHHLQTTRSWDFLHFPQRIRREHTVESDIIVGIIDSEIWPESDCFIDTGYGPPPIKWQGSCDGLTNFHCNMKLIGAKYYKNDGDFSPTDIQSPRDSSGHGTHVASIIACNLVNSEGLSGLGRGIARGGVPSSRIAVYKVCWSTGCADEDIIVAFFDAINDGVDLLSISMGNYGSSYCEDPIAFMSFQAMNKGILTTMPAGNEGPGLISIKNVAPWALTVAASASDRNYVTNLKLGNEKTLMGKIVICDEYNFGRATISAGAIGMVIQANVTKDNCDVFALPTTYLDMRSTGYNIMSYVSSSSNPIGSILKSTQVFDFDASAPYIASFSSRGPNPITPHILKPDLCAPGVKILGAWTLANSLTRLQEDLRRLPYNIVLGTSSACPHVTDAAAYVKSFHPSWSPAAIKSALMTTEKRKKLVLSILHSGAAGKSAIVKSAKSVAFPSEMGVIVGRRRCCYSNNDLKFLSGMHGVCNLYGTENAWNLNIPSFSIPVMPSTHFNVTYTRTVTNVGPSSSIYQAQIIAPPGLNIQVVPNVLHFSSVGQTQTFGVVFVGRISVRNIVSASLSWSFGNIGEEGIIVIRYGKWWSCSWTWFGVVKPFKLSYMENLIEEAEETQCEGIICVEEVNLSQSVRAHHRLWIYSRDLEMLGRLFNKKNDACFQMLENELAAAMQIGFVSEFFLKLKNICLEISLLNPDEKILEARTKRHIVKGFRPDIHHSSHRFKCGKTGHFKRDCRVTLNGNFASSNLGEKSNQRVEEDWDKAFHIDVMISKEKKT
ncbi:cucumisin-like [Impatiens glandulifera]|uniref:cucumisin-like n=1 Tax=Impatiens glandulifera TaxID=253017 RepID=UPI001FB12239|nr:cucumisin-like [Impatiens glandulifera]